MERLRTFRSIVFICLAIIVIEVVLLSLTLAPLRPYHWGALGLIAVMGIYLARIALIVIREQQNNSKQ